MLFSEPIKPNVKSKLQYDCFKAAAGFIKQPHVLEGPDNYRLDRGNVAKSQHDEAINHASVEELDFVYELSGGHKILFTKDDYYKKKITNVRKYTIQEVLELTGKHGHWGHGTEEMHKLK